MEKVVKISIIVLLVLALLLSVACTVICGRVYDSQFSRSTRPDWHVQYGLHYEITDEKYPRETVTVPSEDLLLNGYIFGGDNPSPKGLVVFCHGMGGGVEYYLPEICVLVDAGWQVLSCDFRGSMSSPGETTKGIPQSVVDLDNILTWVEENERFDGMGICLAGHSWGGYAVTNVLNEKSHTISAVVSFAGIYDAFDFIGDQATSMMGSFGKVIKPFSCLYQLLLFGKQAAYTASDGINRAGIPVMIVHGDRDDTINGSNAIPNRRDKITNPHVVYIERVGEGIGTHNGVLKSEASLLYKAEVDAAYEICRAEHGGNLTYEEETAFYDTVDDWKISEPDVELWTQIDAFFTDAVAK